MEKFVLIDGNSLINRAFYALPPLVSSKGVPTQAVYGFTTMLLKAINDIKPKYLAVAFDLPKPTFRHIKYPEYKAQRKKMPDELRVQMPLVKELLTKMGITILEKEGYEADDIIGTMAKRAKCQTYIITGDRDSLQLIDEKISVMLTKKGLSEIQVLDEKELIKEFSLTPCQVVDYKALCGDASDNIPGVAGVGDKTATSLINSYKNLDGVYSHIDEISGKLKEKLIEGKESAYLSYELATIETKVPIENIEEDCEYSMPFSNQVKLCFTEFAFKSLLKRDELFVSADSAAEIAAKVSKPACALKVITSYEELTEVLSQKTDRIAVDIGQSINFSFSYATEYAVNITYSLLDEGLDYTRVIDILKPVLENPKIQKILFDYKELEKQPQLDKLEISNFIDVRLMQYLVDMSVSADTPMAFLESYSIDSHEAATGLMYIGDELKKEIEKLNMHNLYYNIELPLVDILYRMQKEGFSVDFETLNNLGGEFTKKQAVLAGEIFELSNQNFNINSPKQLAKVLFEDMKIPYPIRGRGNSTSAEILEQLEDKHPIARKILDYRFYTKLNSTYVEGLRKAADSDGVVHTEFKQTLTTTGRLSSVEPNLQNIPVRQDEGRLLRGAFVAKKGNVLVSADYSQIELRLMAHYSADPIMVQTYLDGGDIHTSTAAEVFSVQKSEVTPSMRRDAKAVNFGIIYGISDYGLANNLGIAPYKAKEYINKYFERFKGVKDYLDKSVKTAKEKGFATTLFGRVRKIPELYSSNYNIRQFGERVAMNMPLQGSAADIIKIAMIEVDKALQGYKSKLILQVHDELIIDADVNEIEIVKKILLDKMSSAANLLVPLTVEIGVGKSWYECK